MNIAYEGVDRHALGPPREQVALRWLGKDGSVGDYSYGRLQELTNRFTNVPNSLGVGKGDRVLFASVKTGFQPGGELRRKSLALTRRKLGPAVVPREIEFQANLPKTRSGKIMQPLLKAREWGLPEGDLSALENVTEPWKETNTDGKP